MRNQKIIDLAERHNLETEFVERSLEVLLSSLTGMVTFPTILGIMHHVWKPLGVAAHMKVAPLCGGISLLAASSLSALSFTQVRNSISKPKSPLIYERVDQEMLANVAAYTLLCLVTFKVFSGRLRALCPSHILSPGSFANKHVSIPTAVSRVTKSQQTKIQLLGAKYGCHTCGKRFNPWFSSLVKAWKKSRITVDYFADHSPPVAIAAKCLSENMYIQGKLYPQCKSCSYFQASQVRVFQNKLNYQERYSGMVTHAFRLRMYKLWIPWPILFQFGYIHIFFNYFS